MSWQDIVTKNDLEVSSVSIKSLNEETRLDAEYYQPKALKYASKIARKGSFKLAEIADFVVGPFGSTVTADKYIEDSEFSYIRNLDVHSFLINTPEAHIPESLFRKLKQFHIKEDDLLVTVVGTLGKVGIARKKDEKSIFSCKSTIIRCLEVNPYYLLAFLNSDIGQTLLLRCKRGAIQEGLNLFDIKTLPISVPSKSFQDVIEEKVASAIQSFEESEELNKTATLLLLQNLELDNVIFDESQSRSIRTLRDCQGVNRFDAEYWQSSFDTVLNLLKKYKNGISTVGDEFDQIKSGFTVIPEENYKYIEIGSINISTGEVEYNPLLGSELPANAKIMLTKQQLITSKVRPNRGATAILDKHEGYIGSGAFTVLSKKGSINLETLFTYLRLPLIRQLLLRYNTGTSYPVITDTDVLNLPIPLVDKAIQDEINRMVNKSSKQIQRARRLLEQAKRAVEIFVEQDESTAMRYLDE